MVGESSQSTKWVVIAAVLSAVLVAALLGVVVLLREPAGPTRAIETTTSTTTAPATTNPTTTSTPATTEPDDVVVDEQELTLNGRTRRYLTISPRTPPPAEGHPVVMVLHGLGVDARAMSRAAAWRAAVARDGFVAVFPQGVENSWNLGPCCVPASLLGVPDLAFLDQLLDELVARPELDAERVYLTGFSNGALMAYELACRRSETFAAVAPMAGANLTGCEPTSPLSLQHMHSDTDLVVPFEGGVALGSLLIIDSFPSVPGGVASWAAADGCAPEPVVERDDDVERRRWADCDDGTEVELILVPGVGHEWLRRGAFDPLEEMLGFFGLS